MRYSCQTFSFVFYFPCSADRERDWLPCKVVYSGWQPIRWSVRNNNSPRYYAVDPMLRPSGNPFKCHEEVLHLQPMIPPKRFDLFSPLTGGCSEGLDAFRFFFKQRVVPYVSHNLRREAPVQNNIAMYRFFVFFSPILPSCSLSYQ